jgi:signal transduction histidine kinase
LNSAGISFFRGSVRQIKSQHAWTAVILIASMLLVALVTWFLPSLSAVSTNILFRLRGPFGPADDIVIVAIDDQSLQRIGRWPWPRSVMADALDKISVTQPRAVGLDIVYGEPSVEADDLKLAEAVKKNGRVVLPAQLIAREVKSDERNVVVWLRPAIGNASAAVGHAHASPDVDGILRGIQLSKADDNGTRLWAFGLEVVRITEGISPEDFEEKIGALRFGNYQIPLREEEAAGSAIPGVSLIRPNEMLINYAGPAATFPRYSIADVVDGRVPSAAFADKIVLIGAVAPAMGDARVSPFMHYGANARQAGQEMPGVEVHANIINTIRGRLWLRNIPEHYSFLISLGIILLTAVVIIRLDGWSQVLGLAAILIAILGGSFLAFKNFLIIPPLPGMLAGFAAAIPLLLNRTVSASRRLDLKLEALARTQKGFLLDDENGAATKDQRGWLDLPRDLAWKLRAVDDITTRLLARMNFMDRVLSGMGEGVLVAEASGRVVFANPEAAEVFDSSPETLSLQSFADLFIGRGILDEAQLREALSETSSGRVVHKEFETQSDNGRRHYELHLTSISAPPETQPPVDSAAHQPDAGLVIGLVALITDTTRRVELDQIRMETLQLVSHELRTPLTSIQGLSDVLLKFPVGIAEAKDMLATIHAEAVRLTETINRYLDIARLEAGAQSLRKTNIDLAQLIDDCVNRHKPVAAERGITIVLEVSPALSLLSADAQLLTQAINNLLSNAIKYSPDGSQVSVEAKGDDDRVLITVHDHGPGIPAEEHERVFEKFYRLERDAASEVVGTGLGLSLVKEIVEKHGGLVRVESASGGGSVFTIELPV